MSGSSRRTQLSTRFCLLRRTAVCNNGLWSDAQNHTPFCWRCLGGTLWESSCLPWTRHCALGDSQIEPNCQLTDSLGEPSLSFSTTALPHLCRSCIPTPAPCTLLLDNQLDPNCSLTPLGQPLISPLTTASDVAPQPVHLKRGHQP